jgi:nucleoid-associated protein Lsr2
MAVRIIEQLVDDLDGGPATQTTRVGYNGDWYRLDLSDEHAKELQELLLPYMAAAGKPERVVGKKPATGKKRPPSAREREDADIRAWAVGQSVEVPARGPVPENVRAAYRAGHAGHVGDAAEV